MKVLDTQRLVLRWLEAGDAAFILRLVNEPSWLRYIGDKGIKSLRDAEDYMQSGPVDMCQRLGFGLWLAELKPNHVPIGICGLIKRETLDDVDIGFALLPEFCKQGYALEAAAATLGFARARLKLSRVVAITSQDNEASGKLLEKLGFQMERLLRMDGDEEELKLFAIDLG